MKIRISRYKQAASTLVTVLVICAILSMSIGYYMSLVDQQNVLSARSQTWNVAMSVCEAGLEEGLQQINSNSSNMAADGWYYDGTLYWRSNTLPDNSSYTVNVDFRDPNAPIIVARSYVTISFQTTLLGAAGANGASTVSKTLTRAIRVRASRSNLFLNALVAKHTIDLNGNGVTTDSYDSGDPGKSAGGHYDWSVYHGDMGDVAANDGVLNALDIGNANIYGHAHVGAGGSMEVGPNGGIGEHSWQNGNVGAEPGWFATDANFTFPDTSFPYSNNSAGVLNSAAGGNIVTTLSAYTSNTVSSTTYPGNVSPWTSISTNWSTVNSVGSLPSPLPSPITTNYTTQPNVTDNNRPANGTYVPGTLVTNYNGGSGTIKNYTFTKITGTTYTYISQYAYSTFSTNTTYITNHYDNILMSGTSYYFNSLTGSTYIAGMDVKLVVANGIDLTQPFVIPQSSAVQVWTGGTSVTLSGNEGANQSGIAGSFIIYCAPSVTSFTLNGNAAFTGVIVAPNAAMDLNGSGSQTMDFSGSLMVSSVRLTGHFNFHYDEALRRVHDQGRYLVTTWDEIP